jgi:multidrug efflux pump subunit AcrA (membrane-fusion protein)
MIKKIIYLSFAAFFFGSCGSDEHKIKPEVTDLTESVYSSVIIQPDSIYDVYATVNGILSKLFVSEGDAVKTGAPIMQISNTAPKLNAENASIALQLAKENAGSNSAVLSSIRDELATAKLNLSNAELNYNRQKSLWDQGVGSKAELDARKLAYETARSQVNMVAAKLTNTKNQLNTSLQQARVQYEAASSNSQDFKVRSAINGKVYSITKKQGEIVTPQIPVAKIGSANSFIIEMLIDEVDIARVEVGQKIIITLDAYPKKAFTAKLAKIYPAKDERTQTFKVEGVFEEKPAKLYPGLSGEANIVIAAKKNIITIPNEFLTADHEVKTQDGLKKVEIGLSSMERTEILSGLDSSTFIYPIN